MSDQILEKYVYCSKCNDHQLIHVDIKHIQSESGSGITKRSILHQDHLLILEIDSNGDIRGEKTVDIEEETLMLSDPMSEFFIWLELIRESKHQNIMCLILDNPQDYRKTIMKMIQYGISSNLEFEVDQNENSLILRIMPLKFIITDLENLEITEKVDIMIIIAQKLSELKMFIEHARLSLSPSTYVHVNFQNDEKYMMTKYFQKKFNIHHMDFAENENLERIILLKNCISKYIRNEN